MSDLYEDIYDYLESVDNEKAVKSKGLEELIYKIHASVNVDYDTASLIVRMIFQEIRNAMLRGDEVNLRGFGKFYISSPKKSGNKIKVFPKFQPHNTLMRKINERGK